jgi:hypothetical protein
MKKKEKKRRREESYLHYSGRNGAPGGADTGVTNVLAMQIAEHRPVPQTAPAEKRREESESELTSKR